MARTTTRRDALKRIGAAGAGLVLSRVTLRGRTSDILIAGQPVEIAVSTLGPRTIRITILPVEAGKTTGILNDGALVSEAEGKRLARTSEAETFAPVQAGELRLKFIANPPAFEIERNGKTIQALKLDAAGPGMTFLLGDGPLLGLGQGGPQFDRKGTTDRMRSGQGGYKLSTHGGRVPIQWLIGTGGGWAIFIHQPLGTFDFTGPEGIFIPAGNGLPLDVFIVASSDPAEILREYARITGFAEMPPLWSLGYMQSHRTLAGPDEILGVAKTMREKKLPCDALIYLGTEFTPSGWNTRNGEFAWHSGNFPEPKKMIDELHGENFKVVLHIVIEGHFLNGTVNEPCLPENAVPSGRAADNKWPENRNVPCYWPYHKPLMDVGVDGWWPDQGDGYDAPSRLNRVRMYWEGTQLYRPNVRPFALHRNGYAGMQRYAGFLWSGDVQSRWETLKTHVSVAINSGLSGIPYWGTDIGGFIPTEEYTGELHVRWFQFGAFCTSFRAHGRNWHLRLPWGWDGGDGGPNETKSFTADPNELKNSKVEPILRKYLELRYRLLPYTYTAVRDCCETGLPIIRALWIHHPGDPAAVARGDQYFWGRDILVSPVVEKGAEVRRLYLPRGTWFDFWTEEKIEGGREIERKVDLETMPLHVRAGAVLPLGPVRQHVHDPGTGPKTLVVYPGADGRSFLYEDDGGSFAYQKGEWRKLEMGWNEARRMLSLKSTKGSPSLPLAKRAVEVRLAGETGTRTVVFDGRPLEVKL